MTDYKYQEALKQIKLGNAILFYGSGMAHGVKNILNEYMPMANALAEKLSPDSEGDLALASQIYIDENGENSLIDLLREQFSTGNPSDCIPEYYKVLAKEKWRSIFTTNYDDSFEMASKIIGKNRSSVDPEMTPRDYQANDLNIIHINGFIHSITRSKINTTFKLTEGSYLADQFIKGNWYQPFLSEVKNCKAIFFIGYSLRSDFDIKKIFFDFNDELKNKTFFITSSTNSVLSRFGNVIPIGVEKFAIDIDHSPNVEYSEEYQDIINFDKFEIINENINEFNVNEDVYKLITLGVDNEFLLQKSIEENFNDYAIKRHVNYLNALSKYNYYIVSGDIGTGKSLLSKQISYKLINDGYDVYYIKSNYYNVDRDIDLIGKIENNKKAFLLDFDYFDDESLDIIRSIVLKNPKWKVILPIRRAQLDDLFSRLIYEFRLIKYEEIMQFNTDLLSDDEYCNFINYLKKNGLWVNIESQYSGLSESRIIKLVKEDSNCRLSDILLSIFNSKHMISKYNSLLEQIEKNRSFMKIIVCAFMLNLAGRKNISRDELFKFTDEEIVTESSFSRNPIFNDFFYQGEHYIAPSSSLFAKFLLSNFKNSALLTSVLIDITKKIHSLGYYRLYRTLATYTNIQNMLPDKDKRKNIIQFYEGIRALDKERNNPHFWLQYAIARLAYAEINIEPHLELAKTYLDTGMSLAGKIKSFKTFDLETQLSRYYFMLAKTEKSDLDKCLDILQDGINHLDRVTEKDPKRASFRPIQLLCSVIDGIYLNLNTPWLSFFIERMEVYLNRINSSRSEVQDENSVRISKEKIINTIRKLSIRKNNMV